MLPCPFLPLSISLTTPLFSLLLLVWCGFVLFLVWCSMVYWFFGFRAVLPLLFLFFLSALIHTIGVVIYPFSTNQSTQPRHLILLICSTSLPFPHCFVWFFSWVECVLHTVVVWFWGRQIIRDWCRE